MQHVNELPDVRPTLRYNVWTPTHLHGPASLPQFDGYASDITEPANWKDYEYPNVQAARTLWYHDHGVHITASAPTTSPATRSRPAVPRAWRRARCTTATTTPTRTSGGDGDGGAGGGGGGTGHGGDGGGGKGSGNSGSGSGKASSLSDACAPKKKSLVKKKRRKVTAKRPTVKAKSAATRAKSTPRCTTPAKRRPAAKRRPVTKRKPAKRRPRR